MQPRTLSDLIEGFWTTGLIGTAVALGIPDQLGAGSRSSEQIARLCEVDSSCVLRLLRGLQTIGVCRLRADCTFELTDQGQLLRRNVPGSVSGRAEFTSGIMWDLYRQMTTVVKTGSALPAGREGFNRLADHPGLDGMHRAMVESSIRVILDATRVFDFGRYRRVLDVGGGYGGALAALLKRYPDIHGNVLDLAYLEKEALRYLADNKVGGRAGFAAGDFFESVPSGYDCYLLKYIVHDWGDTEARQILHRCTAACGQHAHVILLERVLPEALDESPEHQAIAQIDLAMMMTGGKERTEEEYRALLALAGLQVTSVTATASPCSLIHAIPVPARSPRRLRRA